MSAAAWLTFVLLLPAATWLLGVTLALRDMPEPAAAVGRVVRALLPFVVAAVLLGAAAGPPALAAVVTAIALHAAWSVGVPMVLRRRTNRMADDEP